MPSSFAIGDFSRATHLTVKTLRHYHETGLLEPAHIDPQTGYRRYMTDQIPVAQIIRRFRDLDMPLNQIGAVLSAPDVQTRNALIAAHLKRLESDLTRTQGAVASLRNLLEHPAPAAEIGRRKAGQVTAAAISDVVDVKDLLSWYLGALGELRAALSAQRKVATGPPGGIFSNALFSRARGEATMFIPCDAPVRAVLSSGTSGHARGVGVAYRDRMAYLSNRLVPSGKQHPPIRRVARPVGGGRRGRPFAARGTPCLSCCRTRRKQA